MYLSYCGIRVKDLNRSLKFYTELFGLKEVARAIIGNTTLGYSFCFVMASRAKNWNSTGILKIQYTQSRTYLEKASTT
jgi:catechol 2,3-dioxygenase-like lactoylglutathione lyase family enzyme